MTNNFASSCSASSAGKIQNDGTFCTGGTSSSVFPTDESNYIIHDGKDYYFYKTSAKLIAKIAKSEWKIIKINL